MRVTPILPSLPPRLKNLFDAKHQNGKQMRLGLKGIWGEAVEKVRKQMAVKKCLRSSTGKLQRNCLQIHHVGPVVKPQG